MTKTFAIIAAALTLGGCASTYQLTLMPRDSGKLYYGTADDAGGAEGAIAITIEGRTYAGTWVEVVSDRATATWPAASATGSAAAAGAWAGLSRIDNPTGGEAKALLRSRRRRRPALRPARRRRPRRRRRVPRRQGPRLRRADPTRRRGSSPPPEPDQHPNHDPETTMPHNAFDTLKTFQPAAGKTGQYYSLPALAETFPNVKRLPVSIRIVLESVLRNVRRQEGHRGAREAARRTGAPRPRAPTRSRSCVARIVLQDFTGVPLLADLAAMRGVAARMGKDPKIIEPLVPVDLVVDHSVQIDHYGGPDALDLNMKLEFERNRERYEFMKWGMQAFDTFKVVPPGIGIVHQVNLEYLARGVLQKDGVYYPDTLVGTDSHTTMINGIGVVGWGVGGIEAEAGMLGQPVYFLTPDVVGVNLTGKLREGVTATDLVLTVTEMLRKAKVVGKFVEFFGEGAETLAVPDRATIANMAPEYGATMGFFPVDDAHHRVLPQHRPHGRGSLRARGLLQGAGAVRHAAARATSTTRTVLELDLAIDPALASRARSARRTASTSAT